MLIERAPTAAAVLGGDITDPENAYVQDGVTAAILSVYGETPTSSVHYKGFGFGGLLPAGAIVSGFAARTRAKRVTGDGGAFSLRLREEENLGTAITDGDVASWSGDFAWRMYGGDGNLWGWSAPSGPVIGSADFGLLLVLDATGSMTPVEIALDYLELWVYYLAAGALAPGCRRVRLWTPHGRLRDQP